MTKGVYRLKFYRAKKRQRQRRQRQRRDNDKEETTTKEIGIMVKLILLSIIALLLLPSTVVSHPLEPIDIEAELVKLPEMSKTHYYWYPSSDLLNDPNSLKMRELARITGSYCVSAAWTNETQMEIAVNVCKETKATIGVNFSPWNRVVKPGHDPSVRDDEWFGEVKFFTDKALRVRELAQDVEITAIIIDAENFKRILFPKTPEDNKYNQSMKESLDVIHAIAVSIFPKARIIWYGRGMAMNPVSDECYYTYPWTEKEMTQVTSTWLYGLPEMPRMVHVYKETVKQGNRLGIELFVPYIALASGHQRNEKGHKFVLDWPYDPGFSYDMGVRVASWPEVENIVFYPAPFDKRVPEWGRHFVEYVKGFNSGI